MANKKIKKVTTTVTEEIIDDFSNEKTHIICILDRSGSMADIITDSIGGFNTFLKKQKELPDEATITVALFDDRYDLLFDNIDIKKAKELTKSDWIPRGTTALYDAIGKTINAEKTNFVKLGKEAPAKVLVCIVTDGMENASREYKLDNIKKLIKECEKEDWNFIYLAANQDAFTVGSSFGVSQNNTFTYTASGAGVANMSNVMYSATANYRGMSARSANFGKMSKSLIDQDDKTDDEDNITNGTTVSNGNITTNNVTFTSSST